MQKRSSCVALREGDDYLWKTASTGAIRGGTREHGMQGRTFRGSQSVGPDPLSSLLSGCPADRMLLAARRPGKSRHNVGANRGALRAPAEPTMVTASWRSRYVFWVGSFGRSILLPVTSAVRGLGFGMGRFTLP